MNCPKCKSKTGIKDSRSWDGKKVYRRRFCKSCDHKFSTLERIAAVPKKRKQAAPKAAPTVKKRRLRATNAKNQIIHNIATRVAEELDWDHMSDEELEAHIMGYDDDY